MPKMPENAIFFECIKCNFKCSKKSNYNTHLNTAKHKMIINGNTNTPRKMPEYICHCGKLYKHSSGLSRHKNKCNYIDSEPIVDTPQNTIIDSSLVIELLKENQEFKGLIMEQMMEQAKQNNDFQKQLLEVVKDGKVINNTNNNTTNITNNNKFNLNVFLNETCKDAINLNDFIQSIELNVNDFINTGELGFVKGISNIMVERIRDM